MKRTDRDITLTGGTDMLSAFSVDNNTAYVHLDYSIVSNSKLHVESTYGGSGKWTKLEDSEIIMESSNDSMGINVLTPFPSEVLIRLVINGATGTINSITYKS